MDCLWPGLRDTRHGEVGLPEDLRTSSVSVLRLAVWAVDTGVLRAQAGQPAARNGWERRLKACCSAVRSSDLMRGVLELRH